MNDIEERELSEIKAALARIEEFLAKLARYEPFLAEVARRMEGPMRWRRTSG